MSIEEDAWKIINNANLSPSQQAQEVEKREAYYGVRAGPTYNDAVDKERENRRG